MVSDKAVEHRCSRGGIWLPRVLAAAVLLAAVIASRTLDPDHLFASSRIFRPLVIVLGGIVALWILKDGGIVRWSVRAGESGLVFRVGRKENLLEYRDIVHIDYHLPFSDGRHWLTAMVLTDRLEGHWRIPSFIGDGKGLLEELLRQADRNELIAWSDARRIPVRIGRGAGSLGLWYGVAGTVLALGLLFPLF